MSTTVSLGLLPSTSSILDQVGSTQGDILIRSSGGWIVLAPGTSGQVLTTAGASANPSWQNSPATGVTSITAGTGLTGGTITSTGTIAIDSTVATLTGTQTLTNKTLVAPVLGTPASGNLANCTFPILNQNTTGTAGNITATSNSTLTTLSALSLPYSQLSGTVPTWNQNTTGTAANITATSNSSLTTLSALSLPNTQVTCTAGQVQYGDAGGILGGDSTFTFNDTSKALSATSFIGALTGNVTGNVSGSAGTVTTISGLIIQGTNVTITGSGTSGSPYSIAAAGGGGYNPVQYAYCGGF